MRNYNQGKIYKIVCNITGLTYYGSTCEPILSRRLAKHRSNYKDYLNKASHSHYTTSYKVLENGNCDIILMENYPCNSNDELLSRERYYIENYECVNKIIPSRSHEEYKELNREWYQNYMKTYNKKYREENSEKILKQRREHYYENQETILQKNKERYIKNKETILQKHKEWYEKNKDQIKLKEKERYEINKEKINCICGCSLLKHNLSKHLKSKKHIDFVNNNNNNI